MVDKNMLLVKSIGKYPCLYNHSLGEYSKKEITDKAWNEVALETKLTVSECKEKWKNLRYGFIRSLKPNPDGSAKKKYYLHDDMEFVLPFIKLLSKQSGTFVYLTNDEAETDEEFTDTYLENGQSPQRPPVETEPTEPPRKKTRINYESFPKAAYRKTILTDKSEDPRRMFLLSLLPEVRELSENQMRAFRRKVLALIDEIVDTPNQCVASLFQWTRDESELRSEVAKDFEQETIIKSDPL